MSVVLLGMRSTVVPSARSGLNVFAMWRGAASTVMVCAVTPVDRIETDNEMRRGAIVILGNVAAWFLAK